MKHAIINPEMLEIARESRGMSQTHAAKAVHISQGKLSKAEKGGQSLTQETISALAKLYDYPEDFFTQQSLSSPVSHFYYRRKLSIPQKTMGVIEARIKIFKKAVDILVSAIELPEYELGVYNTEIDTPEEIARKVRYIMGIYSGKIPDLTNLLEKHGIIVIKIDFGNDKLDGLSTITDKGCKIIFSNSRMPNDRQRFSLAHELGHMLMHMDKPSMFVENVELEANRFASEFLMPESEIRNDLYNINFKKLAELKRYWFVSMRSLVRRAHSLNVITPIRYRNLQIEFSKYGYTKNEPITLPYEEQFLIKEIIRLYKEELNYSKEELIELLKFNKSDFNEWFHFEEQSKLRIVR